MASRRAKPRVFYLVLDREGSYYPETITTSQQQADDARRRLNDDVDYVAPHRVIRVVEQPRGRAGG